MKVIFDDKDALFLVGGQPAGKKIFDFYDGAEAEILCIPKSTKHTYLPVFSRFRFKKTPQFSNELFKYVYYGDGVYKILARPQKAALDTLSEPLFQQTFRLSGTYHNVTVSQENGTVLYIDTDNYFFRTDLGRVFDVRVRAADEYPSLFVLTAKEGENDFLCIVAFEEDYREVLRLSGRNISFTENGISVDYRLADMQQHEVSDTYTFSEESNTYTLTEKRVSGRILSCPEELVPYLFLEAVLAGDEETAKELLSAELYADTASYKRFFMGFTAIAEDDFLRYKKNTVNLIVPDDTNNYKCVPFTFIVKKGIITDIRS